jgi:hypothetical protein
MLQANQATAVLKTAIDLRLFAALTDGGTADAVAGKIGCPPRSTRLLLDALAVLGLVSRQVDSYALEPLAQSVLVPGAPTYLGDLANIFVLAVGHPAARPHQHHRIPCPGCRTPGSSASGAERDDRDAELLRAAGVPSPCCATAIYLPPSGSSQSALAQGGLKVTT